MSASRHSLEMGASVPVMRPSVREDFPFLHGSHGADSRATPLIYLDNAATSQKPRQVIRTLQRFYESYNGNVHRSPHTLGQQAEELYGQARANVARFVGAGSTGEIVFTRGCTEAINLLAYSLLCAGDGPLHLQRGDEILLTTMEHHSNLLPWHSLSRRSGTIIKVADIREDGSLDLEAMEALLSDRTRLVCCTHVSNVLGTINPLEKIGRLARSAGALWILDAAQSVPHLPVDVRAVGCDFAAFSGHKMLAPMGIGALYGRSELLGELPPFQYGGGMIRAELMADELWNEAPERFEAGTPNVAGAVALGGADDPAGGDRLEGAVDYLQGLGMEAVQAHETALTEHALRGLAAIPGVRVYGPDDLEQRSGVIAFSIEKNGRIADDQVVAQLLDGAGIAVRAGGHCAHPLLRRLGVPGAVRVSFYVYNTLEEVDVLLSSLNDIVRGQLL